MHSYIRILALRLGTLAVQRGRVQHAVLEKNHNTVFDDEQICTHRCNELGTGLTGVGCFTLVGALTWSTPG